MNPPRAPTADLLMEHSGFLRGLARSLVRDEQQAEDVVQETYLAVLRKPPPPHVRLKAWLAGIARNLALRTVRRETRLKQREQRASERESALPSSDDVVERLEIQQRLAAAVMSLDEPGRSAIVFRYFDGLTPTQIATLLKQPVRTIETRLRRARRRLRASLDTSYGSRATWQAALVPVAGFGLESAAVGKAAGTLTTTGTSTATGAGSAVVAGVIMSTKLIAGAAVVVAAAGAFVAGWHLRPAPQDTTSTADASGVENEDEPGLGTDAMLLANVRAELETEREAHGATKSEMESLATRVKELEAQVAAAAAEGGGTPEKLKPGTTWYTPNEHAEAIEGIDWNQTGEAIVKLNPLLVKLAEALEAGREFKELAELSRWNTPLAVNALNASRKGVPGTGVNGAFTHPSIMANMVHAALVQGGKPLDAGQEKNLRAIADRFLGADEHRLRSYDETTFGLKKLIDEAALKARLFEDIDALLTEEQREILHPASVRGRCGIDLFSSGIVWYTLYRPARFDTPEKLASHLASNVMTHFQLAAELRPVVDELAADYAASFPSGYLDAEPDPLTRAQLTNPSAIGQLFVPVDRPRIAAEQQLAFYTALHDRLPAGSPAAHKVRAEVGFVLPVKWTP